MNLPILRATIAEAFGRRVVFWGLAASAGFLALFGVAFALLYREITAEGVQDAMETVGMGGILTVLGLYVVSFLASFLALTLAAGSVSAEIESGITQAVAVRPITRWSWYLQRWGGLVMLVAGYVVLMAGAVLLIARVIAGYRASSALALIGFMVIMVTFLVTFGMLVSNRLSAMAAGVLLFCYFGISWLGGFVGFIGTVAQRDSLVDISTAVSLVAPTDGLWRAASFYAVPDGLNIGSFMGGGPTTLPFATFAAPSPLFLTWAGLLGLLLLGAGALGYSRRDL